jgi:hypothetical protein
MAVSAFIAGLQIDRSDVGDVGGPVDLDQFEDGIDRAGGTGWGSGRHGSDGERANAGNAGAGRNGQETTSRRRIDRRVCGWRAKHAISSGHLVRASMARVRAGAEAATSPRLAFMLARFLRESKLC